MPDDRPTTLVGCGRCARGVRPRDAELCWYSTGFLCADCWDAVGHCGHPEAEAANDAARRWRRGDAPPQRPGGA